MKNTLVILFAHLSGPNELSTGIIYVDPCCAESILGNMKLYFHFLSFLHTEMAQVVEILPGISCHGIGLVIKECSGFS